MFNIINEQDLITAFLDKGCSWADARMLAMEAKLILMFEDIPMEEGVQSLLSKKAAEESEADQIDAA